MGSLMFPDLQIKSEGIQAMLEALKTNNTLTDLTLFKNEVKARTCIKTETERKRETEREEIESCKLR